MYLCFWPSSTGADSESENSDDEDHAHQSSLDSDMETDDVHVAPPMATGASTTLSLVIEEEAELSEKEMKKLAKAAKTSFNWIQRTSDVPATSWPVEKQF